MKILIEGCTMRSHKVKDQGEVKRTALGDSTTTRNAGATVSTPLLMPNELIPPIGSLVQHTRARPSPRSPGDPLPHLAPGT